MIRAFCAGIAFLAVFLNACATVQDETTARNYYKVYLSEGDSLGSIADRYNTTADSIVAMNGISDVSLLKVGQMIKVPKDDLGDRLIIREDAKRAAVTPVPQSEPDSAAPAKKKGKSKKESKGLLFGQQADAGASATVATPLIWPIEGKLSSLFGWRHGRLHAGLDLTAQPGTAIFAAASGQIVESKWERGYGNMLVIQHQGFMTLYGHLSKVFRKKGDIVAQGDKVAMVGRSGNARGYHLHFEYHDNDGKARDPLEFLPEERLISGEPTVADALLVTQP